MYFSKWNLFLNVKNLARVLVSLYSVTHTHKSTSKDKNSYPIDHSKNDSIMIASSLACPKM